MTCEQFLEVLPELGSGNSTERVAHLRSCSTCAGLLVDLNEIARRAKDLQASEEPTARVWQSIRSTLQDEGVIHEARTATVVRPNVHILGDPAHVRSCAHCAEVLADLDAISEQARLLKVTEGPSPRVWIAIEATLRSEGLIREPEIQHQIKPASPRWKLSWLVPLAATAAIVLGMLVFQHGDGLRRMVDRSTQPTVPKHVYIATDDERQIMQMVAERTPALSAAYEADLRAVNDYIDEAESAVRANPGDEMVHHHLVSAYEQRAMMYEMAMNGSLR